MSRKSETEKQLAMLRYLSKNNDIKTIGFSYTVPKNNVLPFSYEMDMLAIRYNRMVTEYEIKETYADFMQDFKKEYKVEGQCSECKTSKHKLMETAYKYEGNDKLKFYGIANRHSFVCFRDLIPKNEVPDHSGLYYISKRETKFGDVYHVEEVKAPPLLSSSVLMGATIDPDVNAAMAHRYIVALTKGTMSFHD